MTRQERVKRYMEILNNNDKGNNTINWSILDKLTDNELFDEAKVMECMSIIDRCDMRMENNPNKYPENIMRYVRQNLGVDEYDDSRDTEINGMTADEVFECVCNWNGLINYANTIKSWVNGIYKTDF